MNLDYQTAFCRLEEIANLLEAGNLSLENSLKLYEEGAALALELRKILETAEQKLTMLHLTEDPND